MEIGEDFYALCREYEKLGDGFFSNERRIRVGTRNGDIIVENFFLFLDKYKNKVARLSYDGMDHGGLWGAITDHRDQCVVYTFVPADDLVKSEDIIGPLKD